MRVLSLTLSALAVSAFAIAPAAACEWMKSAESTNQTVVEVVPETTDVSIATNDLSEAVLKEVAAETAADDKAAE
jgi:hypothetical protein